MNPDQIRTNDQSIKLNTLVSKLGIDKETKANMVLSCSNGRTSSSKYLTIAECGRLINALEGNTAPTTSKKRDEVILQKTRWRLIYTLRDKGMKLENGKPDMERINNYTRQYWSTEISAMRMDELNKYIGVVKKWRTANAGN